MEEGICCGGRVEEDICCGGRVAEGICCSVRVEWGCGGRAEAGAASVSRCMKMVFSIESIAGESCNVSLGGMAGPCKPLHTRVRMQRQGERGAHGR